MSNIDITYLSASSAKEFHKSTSHYLRYKLNKPEPSAAMEWGTAVHKFTLEPSSVDDNYYCLDEGEILGKLTDNKNPRATKVYKEWLEGEQKKAGARKMLNKGEWITLQRIAAEVSTHPQTQGLFEGVKFEVPIEGEIYGVKFKGFADIVGDGFVADLKTTRSAHPDDFGRDAYNLMYYLQAAVYCKLLDVDRFAFIAVEATADPIVQVYWMDMEYISYGNKLLKSICERFKAWDGSPEGYSEKPMYLTPPAWAK